MNYVSATVDLICKRVSKQNLDNVKQLLLAGFQVEKSPHAVRNICSAIASLAAGWYFRPTMVALERVFFALLSFCMVVFPRLIPKNAHTIGLLNTTPRHLLIRQANNGTTP